MRCNDCSSNKAFIDISLCPGIAMPLVPYRPLRPDVTSSIKLEVGLHNVSQRRHRKTESQPKEICAVRTKFRKYLSSGSTDMLADRQTDTQTDRLTDRRVDHNSFVFYCILCM